MDDNTYSRVVRWLKIILPLLALAVLSTLFLVARTVDPAQQLPFADVDVEELAREQRIGAPRFSGVTAEGAAIALSAVTAAPDAQNDGRMTGDTVEARIDFPNGEAIDISAAAMELNIDQGSVALQRAVTIRSSTGYSLDASHIDISLDRTYAQSQQPVTVHGALGRINAGAFELVGETADKPGYVLVFKNKVKLLYVPGS